MHRPVLSWALTECATSIRHREGTLPFFGVRRQHERRGNSNALVYPCGFLSTCPSWGIVAMLSSADSYITRADPAAL